MGKGMAENLVTKVRPSLSRLPLSEAHIECKKYLNWVLCCQWWTIISSSSSSPIAGTSSASIWCDSRGSVWYCWEGGSGCKWACSGLQTYNWNLLLPFDFTLPIDQSFRQKVAAGSERVVTMLPNNAIVEAVYKVRWQTFLHIEYKCNWFQEVLDNATSGSLLIDCSTVSDWINLKSFPIKLRRIPYVPMYPRWIQHWANSFHRKHRRKVARYFNLVGNVESGCFFPILLSLWMLPCLEELMLHLLEPWHSW